VANHDETIDLTTLREVERLLSSTEFASIDDLAQRAGPGELAQLSAPSRRSRASSLAEGADPLPRRR
jgi:hypothetical protein